MHPDADGPVTPTPANPPLLPKSFYSREALVVARDLLGKRLCHGPVVLRITEVEAYREGDSANHCHRGRTPRNATMFGPPGRAYVYLCYGIHHLLNVVTGPEGTGTAVLLRSGEVESGLAVVRERRGGRKGPELLTGPGRLSAALGLDLGFDTHALHEPGGLEIREGPRVDAVLSGPRIGIGYANPEDIAAPWRLAVGRTRWVGHRRTLGPLEGV